MKRSARLLLGLLGAAHVLVAVALLPAAAFFGIFSWVAIVPGLLWLAVLGFRLLRPDPALGKTLRATHMVVAPLAALLIAYGLFSLHAAQQSAEGGGGLLGPFGLVPIVMGVLAGCLSLVSLVACRSSTLRVAAETDRSRGGCHRLGR